MIGMANIFYDPGEQRAAKVEALFTRIATRYDLINDLQSFGLHRRWKRRVVELGKPQPGARALDVCCGTGDLAVALARRSAEVVGLDFSERMLELAARKAEALVERSPGVDGAAAGLRPVFVRGDAQRLPFPDASFDLVTMGYGLRNLSSWETGLREMQRVAKPGARIVILEFGKPDNAVWRWLYFAYLKLFVPLLGLLVCGQASAYAYILESLKQYPGQIGVANRMRELGFANVGLVNLLGGVMSINYGEKGRMAS
jgi:demethylmenaquinone methyltransferase/2-methoxy-6-polyprenyl-1,4-benzoquinol methylase